MLLLTVNCLGAAPADEADDAAEATVEAPAQGSDRGWTSSKSSSTPKVRVQSPQEKWRELHEEWLRSNKASTARRRQRNEPSPSLEHAVPRNPSLLDMDNEFLDDDTGKATLDSGPGSGSDSDPDADPNKLKKISSIPPFYIPASEGQLPEEFTIGQAPLADRAFSHSTMHWEASDLFHYPLFFEDPGLERYGHVWNPIVIEPLALQTKACLQQFAVNHPVISKPFVWIANPMGDYPKPYFDPYMNVIQPLISSTKFGCEFMLLPYYMTLDPIFSRNYALGYYQPGDVAPYKIYQFPLNADAAFRQGAVMAGIYFGIPRP